MQIKIYRPYANLNKKYYRVIEAILLALNYKVIEFLT